MPDIHTIRPYFLASPRWLLLGGPNKSSEARVAHQYWPGIKVIGVEPHPDAITWQYEHRWPENCPLIHAALSDKVGETDLWLDETDLAHATITPRLISARGGAITRVATTTWDALDGEYGPFDNAVLWMDIEGAEYSALLGAEQILARGAVVLALLEIMPEESKTDIDLLMDRHNFRCVAVDDRINYIYTPKWAYWT